MFTSYLKIFEYFILVSCYPYNIPADCDGANPDLNWHYVQGDLALALRTTLF